MIRFEVNQHHIRERFAQRYDAYRDRSEEIIDRVLNTLRENTPDDWRFTESPTSRFFVMEEETNAKFMGMSYRESPRSRQIVKDIHDNTDNFKYLFDNLKRFVKEYISDVLDPNLPIVHQIRTVYPEKKANIAEEKHLAEAARSAITTHVIPVASKKIASRPNIVVTGDSVLWVRQYMNWLSMKPRSREYYLFHPLKRDGIERNRCAIFVYSESGKLEMLPEERTEKQFPDLRKTKDHIFSCAKNHRPEPGLRSENYWKVPTYLDRRFIDLDFKERHLHSVDDAFFWKRQNISSDLLELYFIIKIREKARKRLYR